MLTNSENDFYILLPSKSDSEGTAAKYNITLDKTVTLPNYMEWEMALVEISFVSAINTFSGDEYFQLFKDHEDLVEKQLPVQPIQFSKYKTETTKDGKELYTVKWNDISSRMKRNTDFLEYISWFSDRKTRYWWKARLNKPYRVVSFKMSAALAWILGLHPIPEGYTPEVVNHNIGSLVNSGILKEQTISFPADNTSVDVLRELHEPRPFIVPNIPDFYTVQLTIKYNPKSMDIPTPLEKQHVPAGRFSNIHEIATVVNTKLFNHPSFKRHKLKLSKQVKVDKLQLHATPANDPQMDGEILTIEKRLASILGFTQRSIKLLRGKPLLLKADHSPDYQQSIYSIYVYCNLCDNMFVGDKRVPLLRNVTFNTERWSVSVLFNSPLYVQVNTGFIDKISVELRDDMGELIQFIKGNTVITLHFRRRL